MTNGSAKGTKSSGFHCLSGTESNTIHLECHVTVLKVNTSLMQASRCAIRHLGRLVVRFFRFSRAFLELLVVIIECCWLKLLGGVLALERNLELALGHQGSL